MWVQQGGRFHKGGSTNLGELTCSEAIQQMRGREEVQALYMAVGADQGGGR